jgi:hypothetical protein
MSAGADACPSMITFDQHQRCRLFANDVHPGGQHDPRARLNRRCALYTFLLRLPACVGGREADAAGTVARGPRVIFGKEEDPVGEVAAAGDGTQRGGTVEAAVDGAAAVAAERPRLIAGVRFAVGTDKCPNLAHSRTSCPTRLLQGLVPVRPQPVAYCFRARFREEHSGMVTFCPRFAVALIDGKHCQEYGQRFPKRGATVSLRARRMNAQASPVLLRGDASGVLLVDRLGVCRIWVDIRPPCGTSD